MDFLSLARNLEICPYCEKDFSCSALFENRRTPLLLPCNHGICALCFIEFSSQSVGLKCKVCSFYHTHESLFKANLPLSCYSLWKCHSNIHGSIFKNIEINKTKDIKSLCFACNSSSETKCEECNKIFCPICFEKVHSLVDALKSHTLIQIPCEKKSEYHCTAHGFFGEYFCKSDLAYLCNICVSTDSHKSHQIVSIDKVCSVNRDVDNSDVMEIACYQPCVSSSTDISNQNENKKRISAQISLHFMDLLCKIQKIEERLQTELSNNFFEDENDELQIIAPNMSTSPTVDIKFSFDAKIFSQLENHCSLKRNRKTSKLLSSEPLKARDEDLAKALGARIRCIRDRSVPSNENTEFYMEGGELRQGRRKNTNSNNSDGPGNLVISAVRHVPSTSMDNTTPEVEFVEELGPSENKKMDLIDFQSPNSQAISLVTPKLEAIDTFSVCLTHTISPSDFYVQKESDSQQIKLVNNEIINLFRQNKLNKNNFCPQLIPGRLYLVRYAADRMWYRGKFLRMVANKMGHLSALIYFIDFGNTEKCTSPWIRSIPHHLASYPPYATHCRLHNLKPYDSVEWSQDTLATFRSFTDSCLLEMRVYVETPDVLQVDLFKGPQGKSLCKQLVFQELAEFINIEESPEELVGDDGQSYVKPKSLVPGEILDAVISYVVSPAEFYFQRLGIYAKALSDAMVGLGKFFADTEHKNLSFFNPVPGKMCACLYAEDMQWYRAEVIQLFSNKQVEVHYVDYGMTESVERHRLRHLPADYTTMPIAAYRCSLFGIQPINKFEGWTKDACISLSQSISNKRVQIFVERAKDLNEIIVFDCNDDFFTNINNKLVKSDLAVSLSQKTSMLTITSLDGLKLEDDRISEGHASPLDDLPEVKVKPEDDNSVAPNDNLHEPSGKYNSIQYFIKSAQTTHIPIRVIRTVNPHLFYAHFTDTELEESYRKLFGVLQEEYRNSQPVAFHKWKVDDNCACFNENTWFRAKIMEFKNDEVLVNLYDIGEEAQVPLENLRTMPAHLGVRKARAIRCHLPAVVAAGDSDNWTQSAIEFLVDEFATFAEDLNILIKGDAINESLPVDILVKCAIPCTALEPSKTEIRSLSDKLIESGLALRDTNSDCSMNRKRSPSGSPGPSIHKKTVEDKEAVEEIDKNVQRQKELYGSEGVAWLPPEEITTTHLHVIPTHVDDEGIIYFHNADVEESNLKEIKETLTTVYDDSIPGDRDLYWLEEQPCVAKYDIDNHWYRGLIKKVETTHIVVHFIDYGNTEPIDVKNLRKTMFKPTLPIQAHRCKLFGIVGKCQGGTWNKKVLDLVQQLIVDKKCHIIVKTKSTKVSPLEVQLLLPNKSNLGELLVQMEMASVVDDNEVEEAQEEDGEITDCYSAESFRHNRLNEDVPEIPINVTAFCKPNIVYVQVDPTAQFQWPLTLLALKNQIAELSKLNNELNLNSTKFLPIDNFQPDLPCCVYSSTNGGWYRGVIIKKILDKIVVKLVDYGNDVIVHTDCVKRLPLKYMVLPAQAIECRLNEVCAAEGQDEVMSDLSAQKLESCLMTNPNQLMLTVKNPIGIPRVDIFAANYYANGKLQKQLAYQSLVDRGDISMSLVFSDYL